MKGLLLLFALGSLSVPPLAAQEEGSTSPWLKLERIEQTLSHVDSLLFRQGGSVSMRREPIALTRPFSSEVATEQQLYAQRYFRGRTGLEATLGYTYKFMVNVVDVAGNEYMPYNSRYQLAISWNVMQSALVGRRLAYDQIRLEAEQLQNQMQADSLANLSLLQSACVTSELEPALRQALSLRVSLLKELLELGNRLYADRKIMYSELAARKQAVYEAEIRLRRLPAAASGGNECCLLDLEAYKDRLDLPDTTRLDAVLRQHPDIREYVIQQQLLDVGQKQSRLWSRLRVAPFLRGQYYSYPSGQTARANLDVGIDVQIPLDALSNRRRDMLRQQIRTSQLRQQAAEEALLAQWHQQIEEIETIGRAWLAEYDLLQVLQENIEAGKIAYRQQKLSIQQLGLSYDAYLSQLTLLYDLIRQREMLLAQIQLVICPPGA